MVDKTNFSMRKKSKLFFKWLLGFPVYFCFIWIKGFKKIYPLFAFKLIDKLLQFSDDEILEVKHTFKKQDVSIKFSTPNSLCRYRAVTFSSKEPETLRWIEQFGGGGVFYDIGANIGLYSIYYAKLYERKVYSFEPSVFNVKQLCKNISLNSLSDQIIFFPLPITFENQISKFKISNSIEGGALNSFGVEYGFDGEAFNSDFEYSLPGFSLDEIYEKQILKDAPSIIKIDVDGIEHLILQGAKNIISSDKCKSILIEVNQNFHAQNKKVNYLLKNAGFILLKDFYEVNLMKKNKFSHVNNQIWVKNYL